MFLPEKLRESGMSYECLARRLGVSYVTVWRWAKGKYSPHPMLRDQLVELGFDDGKYVDNGPAWMVTSRDSGDGAP